MKTIVIPKIIRTIPLREYAPEFEGAEICVWVNPPKDTLQQWRAAADEIKALSSGAIELDPGEAAQRLQAAGDRLIAWCAEIWSQGPEDTRWTAAEIEKLIEGMADTDPQLWPWLTRRTLELITGHRYGLNAA